MIYITDVTNFLNNTLYESACSLCDERFLNKISRFKFPLDRCRSLSGLLLAQYALACYKYGPFMTETSFSNMKEVGAFPADSGVTLDFTWFEASDTALYAKGLTLTKPEDLLFNMKNRKQILNIVYLKEGKPVFETEENFKFSISHSGDLAVVNTNEGDCGVDLQEFCRIRTSLVDRVLTREEKMKYEESPAFHFSSQKAEKPLINPENTCNPEMIEESVISGDICNKINVTDKNERNQSQDDIYNNAFYDYFFRCWSAKESFLKLTGEGLAGDIKSPVCDVYKGVISREGEIAKCKTGTFFYKGRKYVLANAWRE